MLVVAVLVSSLLFGFAHGEQRATPI